MMVPDLDHASVDQRMNLERCLSHVDFEKCVVTLKQKYTLRNGVTRDRGVNVLHASKTSLDSQYTWVMETGLKEKQEAHLLSKYYERCYPTSSLTSNSREKVEKILFMSNIPVEKCSL